MVRLDLAGMAPRDANRTLRERVSRDTRIEIDNPHSMHNLATALIGEATVVVHGSTGFYTGGFLEGPTLIVEGNTGWYTGDNMMSGEIIVEMNSGSNAAPSLLGGTIVIKGNSGSRAGWGMKGGNLIVCGNVGRWTGKMTLGGRIIVLGEVGPGIGESMYNGVIHVLDPAVEEKIGGNVMVVPISDPEKEQVASLLARYGIDQEVARFKSIVPKVYGRHEYRLFKPTHQRKGRV